MTTSHPYKGGIGNMRKFLAPLVTLLLIASSWHYALAADQAADGQRLNVAPTGSGGSTKAPTPVLIGGMNGADTTSRVIRTDASGNVKVVETYPAMDAGFTLPSLIASASIAGAASDSCQPQDTRRMRLGMLLIKATPTGSDTTGVVRLIFQVRTHLNGQVDSSSTFAIYQYGYAPSMNGTAAAATPDTSVQGQLYKGVPVTGVFATPSANTAWSGEFTVLVQAIRNAHGNSIAVGGHTFYYPSGIAISLASLFGRDIYSPYTSIRVRNASTQACAVTVSLVGTPL
jgi:hypothetical protein